MRLCTFTTRGEARLGAFRGESEVVDLNRAYRSRLEERGETRAAARAEHELPSDMLAFLTAGQPAMDAARHAIARAEEVLGRAKEEAFARGLVVDRGEPGFRLEAPVPRPGTVLAIGVNYKDHAAESKFDLPSRPLVFSKVATCIVGPGTPIVRPRVSEAVDWEGELCFVIGKPAKNVPASEALSYVAGFTIGHDVSVRDWQFHTQTMLMGKGFDTHGPMGPALVTRDEVPDYRSLDLRTLINGVVKQDSNTRHLIFGVEEILEYVTQAFTLRPGDVVFTGTPSGVGAARQPPEFLRAGDVARIEISGLGVLENPVIDAPA
ncbi:MAG: fumarylacetoacetate hydrolase family protein [Deltaproteobacteria bacterium]|nr:fumarylacetoacetate hydrolase family protein [Deltaproteobacteria bacterium]